jgi:hypothetical protein
MKHEDDLSDNLKQPFQENDNSWFGNEQIEKKNTGRSFTRDPYLNHAAGDYEPLQEDSRYRQTDNLEQFTGEQKKVPTSQPLDSQIDEEERLQFEQDNRAEKIEQIRASFGALDHDRP